MSSNYDSNSQKSKDIEIYGLSVGKFKEKKFDEAVEGFRRVINEFPQSPYADDSQYRIAYILICHDNNNWHYTNARKEFQNLLERYKDSRYIYETQNWISILDKLLEHYHSRKKLSLSKKSLEESVDNLEGNYKQQQLKLYQLELENKDLKNEIRQLKEILDELKMQESNP